MPETVYYPTLKKLNPASIQEVNDQPEDIVINLDHGDPMMYESYWKEAVQDYSITIPPHKSLSYFSTKKNFCWFMEPMLEEEIKALHKIVGNAVIESKHIVVGTGSSQLVLAALYALSISAPPEKSKPIGVVAAAPYYSCYPEMATFLQSGLFKWEGDAQKYNQDGYCIEMVTSPNNPDGMIREAVVGDQSKGMIVHDLAYYWPQYTAITSALDHDIMLFTVSKCTGHAGSRIGWAVVKDETIARNMAKFMEITTIGVSKEGQLRAANILQNISLSCQKMQPYEMPNFFEHHHSLLAERWKKLRDILKNQNLFHVPKFPTRFCSFRRESTETYPAFAWMRCREGLDCEMLLKEHKILTRSGKRFGSEEEYSRISMVSGEGEFELFLQRLSAAIKETSRILLTIE